MRRLGGRPLLLGLAALAYAAFLLWYHCPYAGGADSSGYLNSARLLLSGHATVPLSAPAGLPPELLPRTAFVPMGFLPGPSDQALIPKYPVGLPLHFAAVGFFFGLGAATTLVSVSFSLGLLILLYATAREFGVRPSWSVAIAASAAVSPLMLFFALQPMSDLVATVWSLAAVFCALRSARHRAWAAAGGAALAMAVLVRPTNLLLVPALGVALRREPRTWLAFVAGGLPGAGFLAFYNHALYGKILTTGYGDIGPLLAWEHVGPTLLHYARWIPVTAGPLVLAAVALPWLSLDCRRKTVLALWGVPIVAFYSAYKYSADAWWYLRFILPALPALAIAATLVWQQWRCPVLHFAARLVPPDAAVDDALAGNHGVRLPLVWLLVLVTAGWFVAWDQRLQVADVELNERAYVLTSRWATEHLPPDAIIAASQTSGSLLFYASRPSLNWNAVPRRAALRFLAWVDGGHRPLYAITFPFEEKSLLDKLPGDWKRLNQFRQASVWQRSGPRRRSPP